MPGTTLSTRAVFRRFWPFTRGDRRWLAVSSVLLVVAAACDACAVSLFAKIVDNALRSGDISGFWRPAATWVGVATLSSFLVFGGTYLTERTGERFLLRLRTKVFTHLHRQPPGFFERRRPGDLIARLTDDVDTVERFVGSGVVQVITALFSVMFFAGYAVYLSWELALAAFVVVPLFALVTRKFAQHINRRSREQRALNGDITAILEESLANVTVVQAYNRQPTESRRLADAGSRMLATNLSIARLSGLYAPVVHLAQTVSVLAVIGLGAWEIASGRISLGGVLGFAAILTSLYAPVQQLGQLRVMASAAATGSERIIELLDAPLPLTDGPRVLPRARGLLRMQSVDFRYADTQSPVLKGFTLDVHPGELLAITGPSGSGKSTIAKLLLRFYDPAAGTVTLDGVDLRDLTLASLRSNIALVSQQTQMFHTTIHDNIAFGSPTATHDNVVNAAIRADAHDFIAALPDGYDTIIGQHGHGLSGGQRQRLAIARAIVADTPVLVLDEPTASLDATSADRLLGPLRRLATGRTTILITHDQRLTANADRVLAMSLLPTKPKDSLLSSRSQGR